MTASGALDALAYVVRLQGTPKVAARFGVTARTIRRWLKVGVPSERVAEVRRYGNRIYTNQYRRELRREWALELLHRWSAAVVEEQAAYKDAAYVRQSGTRNRALLAAASDATSTATEYRRAAWEALQGRHFKDSEPGRRFWRLYRKHIKPYEEARDILAKEREQRPGHPDYPGRQEAQRRVGKLYERYKHHITELALEFEFEDLPGVGKRQLMSLFFSG